MDTTETLLARVDERTARILDVLEKHVKDDTRIQGDLENRMRKQERFRYLLLGAAALTAGGSGGLIQYLMG